MSTPRFHRLAVNELRRETADAISMTFSIPQELSGDYNFLPGQYLTLRTTMDGEEVRRSYSICSGPDDGELRIAVKKVDGGAFSNWAADELKSGDELDVMTVDRERLIFGCVHWDQFIFLIAEDEPMACPRLDHYGFSVSSRAELDAAVERARAFHGEDPRVDLIDTTVDDQGVVKIHSMYVGYLLPMMIELQYWEFV